MQSSNAAGYRKRQLSARSQAGMTWSDIVDDHSMVGRMRKMLLQPLSVAAGALQIETFRLQLFSVRNRESGMKRIDRKSEASEASPEATIKVEKSEMQTGRNCDADAIRLQGASSLLRSIRFEPERAFRS